MDVLEAKGLKGKGLILIDSKEEVRRYRDCQVSHGFAPTQLNAFHIDAMGWSPEIAKELGNHNYLAYGTDGSEEDDDLSLANPVAIIITPRQRFCPIINPFHSYDWDLMKMFYDTHVTAIELATRYEGMCVEIDQDVDHYGDPHDLLLVDNIVVRAWTPSRLMQAAHRQKSLVRSFMRENDSHLNKKLIEDVLASAHGIGDMRTKSMYISDMEYTNVSCFFTKALGGWVVLRGSASDESVLISKADAMRARGVTSPVDKKILADLDRLGLISYDLEYWMTRLYRLEIIRDSFLMDVLSNLYPDMDYVGKSTSHRKSILSRRNVQNELPETYRLLDRLIRELRRGREPKKVHKKILPYLAHPIESVHASVKEVVWYVLALVCDGRAVVRLYRYDKEGYFEAYKKWKEPWKTWSVKCVQDYYEYRMIPADKR